jgi:hypothetical protein
VIAPIFRIISPLSFFPITTKLPVYI